MSQLPVPLAMTIDEANEMFGGIHTGMSSPPDSYFYTDTGGLVWDRQMGYWTKDDLTADLSSG